VPEWFARLDPHTVLLAFAALAVLLALPLVVTGLRRIWRTELLRGAGLLLGGGLVLVLGLAVAMTAASLHTYKRFTEEREVARVSMRQLGERRFVVTLEPAGAAARHLELRGDEWQIDARMLKWRGIGTLLGLDPVYRLERLSGRYASVAEDRSGPRTVYALVEDPSVDFWALVRRYHDALPFVDALYGSAAYVPMAEGAEYRVSVSALGLVVRPANGAAQRAVAGWK